jgi:RNA polymerase sigma factor (sigma-70 family)
MLEDDNIGSVFVSIRGSLGRAVRHIVPPKEIEDIVQETYVRVCQVGAEREIRSPRSFMFKTAHNLALDFVKRAETRLSDSLDDGEDDLLLGRQPLVDGTLDQVCSDEEFALFCEAVRYLPVQSRRAFVLKKVYGYTQREIAKVMRISERTVEKHISNGIKRCMFFMEQQKMSKGIDRPAGESRHPGDSKKGDRA